MIPLEVTARLRGPIALPHGPLALDSLLAYWVAMRRGLPPLDHQDDPQPIEIPVQREPGGRFHLCSFSVSEPERQANHWVNRRFPIHEAQLMAGPKLRRIDIRVGAQKSYRLPLETQHLRDDMLRWWCIGDRDEIAELLQLVGYLGKRRGVGLGAVQRWTVEPCDPWGDGFPVVRDGCPLRPLPPDWPGLIGAHLGYRTLTYPYHQHVREELCAVP